MCFQLTETQLGNLSSTYALACIICYIPGGWLADVVAPRKLVVIALLASAATYFLVCDHSKFTNR